MAFLTGDIRRANAIFLSMLAPITIRIWYEAVIWRMEQGPQMLGFQVMHLAAGGPYATIVAPVLLFSLMAWYVYAGWIVLIAVLGIVRQESQKPRNLRHAFFGGVLYIAFMLQADALQSQDFSEVGLWMGVTGLSCLGIALLSLGIVGFTKNPIGNARLAI